MAILGNVEFVGKTIESTPWEVLKPCMEEMNECLDVRPLKKSNQILNPYENFQKQQKLEENNFIRTN